MRSVESSEMKSLEFSDLLRYNAGETQRWHKWFKSQPAEVLDLPVEIYGKTARDLVHHILAVELRYAQRLTGEPVSSYEELPKSGVDELFAIGDRAQALLTKYLESATDADLASTLTFPTISAGQMTASKRKIVIHALIHGIRHWAQLATEMRRRGYKTDWAHDFLMSNVME